MDIILNYNLLKSFHIIFTTDGRSFYLPRIYVYHSKEKVNTSSYKTFIYGKKIIKVFIILSF